MIKILARSTIGGAMALAAAQGTAAITVDSDPILYWNDVAIAGIPGGAPAQTRAFAMLNIAMHDSVNAVVGGPNNPFLTGVTSFGGDARAASSQAAYRVLSALNPAQESTFLARLNASLALVTDGAAKTNGIATGNAFGGAILSNRTGDGSATGVVHMPTGLAGDYAPTPPANTTAAFQQWGDVRPFVMSSGDQFRPAAPPELNSPEWVAAFNEVKTIGVKTGSTRTLDQTESALFWNAANGTQWLRIGVTIAEDEGLSTIENARIFALLATALADTQIAGFDAKTEFDFWRPITAIRGDDGNPLTLQDAAWESLNNAPAHQSYVSTLSALSAAGLTTLQSAFGDDEGFSLLIGGLSSDFTSLAEAAQDASDSRLWGGIHYRFDNAAGLQLGGQIARRGLAGSAFNAVPEPATWLTMIGGFGLVGAAMRRRRGATGAAAV